MAPARNLVTRFLDQAAARGDAPFLWAKHAGTWRSTGWRAAAGAVAGLARTLAAHGVAPGDRVVLVAENRPEWAIADLAVMAAGSITVPAYTTNTPDDHRHIVADSGAAAAIVSTPALAARLAPAAAGLRCVVAIEPAAAAAFPAALPWAEAAAANADPGALADAAARLDPAGTACLAPVVHGRPLFQSSARFPLSFDTKDTG